MVESLYTQPYRPRQHIIIVQKFIYTTHNALYIQLVTIYLWGVLILSYNIFCLLLIKLLQSWYVPLLWRGSGRPLGLSVKHYIPGSGG